MKNVLTRVLLILPVLYLSSCLSNQGKEYNIIYSEEEPFGQISKNLAAVIEKNTGTKTNLIMGMGSLANVDSIALGKADFSISENYIPYQQGVNSVMVFFPQILHVFYLSANKPKTFEELILDKKVFIGSEGSGSYRFMQNLFEFFKLDKSRIHITEDAFDEVDVFAGFSDILSDNYLIGLEAYSIYSFDDIDHYGKGSIAEAIALKFPKVHPYIIPQNTYGEITETPILAISSDALLVAREGMSEDEVYQVIKSIFKDRQSFNKISPLLYKGLTETFDRGSLTFPLHEGARVYLDRDEPGPFERYAELFGVLFSITIALVSGIISLGKWRKQRKKDRVDVFYDDLMQIKNRFNAAYTVENGYADLKLIKSSQNRAFQMLIDEDLAADESFRIYMELSKEVILEIKSRINFLKSKQQVQTLKHV